MFVINQPRVVRFPVGDGEHIVFTLKNPSTEQYQTYLTDAFPLLKGEAQYNQVASSVACFDGMCVDVSGVFWQDGNKKPVPLTKDTPDWLAKIPAHIKRAVVAELLDHTKAETVDAKKD